MTKSGRLIGILLVVAGIVVLISCSVLSFFSTRTVEVNQTGGLVLGLVISVIIAIPLVGVGIYLISRGQHEEAELVDSARRRKILDMVKTRGQVNISDIVLDLNATTNQVRDDIYKLVGMGVFTGYVNWDEGVLYSVEASKLTGNKCPNCGAEQTFAGKGVIKCQYCGSEIFL
jgi:hypothetical protein